MKKKKTQTKNKVDPARKHSQVAAKRHLKILKGAPKK